ncbi:MAG: leucyl aminopeptidase family protein [Pseudomonadota bacterium]
MSLTFADPSDVSVPLIILGSGDLAAWQEHQPAETVAWVKANGFTGSAGAVCLLPAPDGTLSAALAGVGGEKDRQRKRFILAGAAAKLPAGAYRLDHWPDGMDLDEACLGWLLAGYRFDRYKTGKAGSARLVSPAGVDAARLETIAAGEALARDLINTPAEDMGPPDLQAAAGALAHAYGAGFTVIEGDDLLTRNFPLIHTVGRAAARAPRLLELNWGSAGPHLTLVGKGVCFDTGGLNLKPGGSMGLMKKDMGGAANVLGLARMIMGADLPIRLRVLVPAVENAVSGNAFRPGDILTSRAGLTVEINNTDAEGRLVLADALALATETPTDLLVSMATLTGAARVAVGPDLAPYFTDDAGLSAALDTSAAKVHDPVWRLPFWDPYDEMIEPGIADLDNAPAGGFAGAITAALFLRRFTGSARYVHFDIYGWQPKPAPARPKGGVGQGIRALFDALSELLDV